MRRIAPSEKMEKELFEQILTSGDPLGEAARNGAQLILQKALEMEVDSFLGRTRYERIPGEPIVGLRNGYEPKTVHMAEGSIKLQVPQVRGNIEVFESVWLQSINKRSKRLMELVPMLYVKGMSQRDIENALIDALDVKQTGKSVITEICKSLHGDFQKWQSRSLKDESILYLFLDGIYLKMGKDEKKPVAALGAYGIRWDGKKVLLHLAVGSKESEICWETFLEDMKNRGLAEPLLTIIDGNKGLKKAVKKKFPNSLIQRCQVHKMRNILCKLPESARAGIQKLIQKAFTSDQYEKGLERAQAIIKEYEDRFPEAMKCLKDDLEDCLTALKFPYAHRKQIRTTNLLERLFGEGKRRSKIIPRFPSESSGMSLLFAVLVDASEGWRGVKMKSFVVERLKQMQIDPLSKWDDPDLKKIAA